MPYLLFAAPAISGFHLHDRLAELAMRRGHRVGVLTTDPAGEAFWQAQGLPVMRAQRHPRMPIDAGVPLDELAELDCRLAGAATPSDLTRYRYRRRLARLAAHLLGLLDSDRPDLILFHEQRSGAHRLLHFLARRAGIATLHLGEGLLPGTLQCDGEGIDGDSSVARRNAIDYRPQQVDTALLDAAIAALHAGPNPGLTLRTPASPSFSERVGVTLSTLWGVPAGEQAALDAWRSLSNTQPTAARAGAGSLPFAPSGPFVALVLQAADSPRLLLDGPVDLPSPRLLRATQQAVAALDPRLELVVVLPDGAEPAWTSVASGPRTRRVPSEALRGVVALAQVVVTVNHPHAGVALLHGTPVVCLGRAIYGVPGVALRTDLPGLPDALASAVQRERPALRERFLTRMLQRDHLWCASAAPDRNGLNGVLQAIERAIGSHAGAPTLTYRAGPSWPLSAR
jgi:hypothetical protein